MKKRSTGSVTAGTRAALGTMHTTVGETSLSTRSLNMSPEANSKLKRLHISAVITTKPWHHAIDGIRI
jgi:hypothetical protein